MRERGAVLSHLRVVDEVEKIGGNERKVISDKHETSPSPLNNNSENSEEVLEYLKKISEDIGELFRKYSGD